MSSWMLMQNKRNGTGMIMHSFYTSKIFTSKLLLKIMPIFLTGIFIGVIYWGSAQLTAMKVVINEICSSNFSLMQDENGKYSDYIELYNPGSDPVSLDGYFLSDDENWLQKFALEPVIIPPKGYYVAWLDGTDDAEAGQNGFRINRSGEEIFLSSTNEEKILDSVAVPMLSYNTSYGRRNDGEQKWEKMTATAGGSNDKAGTATSVALNEPIFSVESGFYQEAFQLKITAPENAVICYTLDGSDPMPDASLYQTVSDIGNTSLSQISLEIGDASQQENIYAARTDLSPTRDYVPSFKVDKATVVRAVSYNIQENTISETVTKVYFVGYDQMDEYEDLPIISVVSDPDNLFDRETGIYGNGIKLEQYKADGGLQDETLLSSFIDENGVARHLYEASNAFNDGREWEKAATITFFDSDHNYTFTQDVGIRTAGMSTRGTPKKSLNIYGRDIYDDENILFPYDFFPGAEYSSVKLRNGGNQNDDVMITDAFLGTLAEGRNVSIQQSKPCIVFLNGEYWGIYNIRERYTEEYLYNHFNVSLNNVYIIDSGDVRTGDDVAQSAYKDMMYILTELDFSYDDVYELGCSFIDIQSLIDYCCINLYIDNRDVGLEHNTALWRTETVDGTESGDGRWRWMVFDLDVSLHSDSNSQPLGWMAEHALMKDPVIQNLMANEQFRKQFCITFMDVANTVYPYNIVHAELMKWKEIYTTQIVKSHQRFFDSTFTAEDYSKYIEDIDLFFQHRFSFAMASLAETFGLTGSLETVVIENSLPKGGTVTINSALLDGAAEWSGIYFTDYPVTMIATAHEGYRFAGWSGDVSGQENRIEVPIPAGGITARAIFEKLP